MLGVAPDHWGGWYWDTCPDPECYWVCRATTWLEMMAERSIHLMEAHND